MSLKALYGEVFIPPVGSIRIDEGSIAYDMGLRTGDRIQAVNGRTIDGSEPLMGIEEMLMVERFTFDVMRDGQLLSFEGPRNIMTRLNESRGMLGVNFDPAIIGNVSEGSAAHDAGLIAGDAIETMDGESIMFWSEMAARIKGSEGSAITVRWRRPDSLSAIVPLGAGRVVDSPGTGILYEASIEPRLDGGTHIFGILQIRRYRTYNGTAALTAGLTETWRQTKLIAFSLKRVFTGQENFRANIGGPIAIAKVTKEAADRGAPFFWNIVAMLSITLAIINILPIPALDGGHLVFLIYEGISRREPSLKLRMGLQQAGMVLLLAFMAFVIFNDILKL
ncbi:MAG: RIP metalloprotease RseP [Bacteroidetes bacterium]|nr:RIP metalloprotease RseP [Bacteroidota bacterium]